jgi:flagellar biosynthesis protein
MTKRKKIKKAVALSYSVGEDAPKIIAKGKGIVADNILDRGDEYKIPIYKDEALANTLTQFDIGDYIPEELYQVVAEVLVYVTKIDKLQDKIYG